VRRLIIAGVAALVAAALPGHAGTAAPACSKAAAKAAILASSLAQRWKDEARHKYGPHEGLAKVLCLDFTRDGRTDLAATFASGGTAGDIAWVAFRRTGVGWKLALARLQLDHLYLVSRGGDLIETQPVYRRTDANCCPTGGFDHVQWHWKGNRFVVARRWHTRRAAP
jgi:hypothetical protein